MELPMSDTEMILSAIGKLEDKVDKMDISMKKTLFGPDGTDGICGTVQKHSMTLYGIPGVKGADGMVDDVETMKETMSSIKTDQAVWNKWLAITQTFAYGALAFFGIKL